MAHHGPHGPNTAPNPRKAKSNVDSQGIRRG